MSEPTKRSRENSERLATWIDRNLAHAIRVRAAVDDVAIREVVETALVEYLDAHPLSAKEIKDALELD